MATDNFTAKGHFLLLTTLAITLVLPVALILLSYLDIISGLGQYVAAIAVIAAGLYIVGGGILMFIQDGKDGKALSE